MLHSISMLRQFRLVLAIALGMLSSGAFGQNSQVTLEAELSRARAYIGDVVTYQVLVRGADDGSQPAVEFPDSVVVEYRGASSQKFTTMQSVNGRQRTKTDSYFKHQYLLTIISDGEILIPPAVYIQDHKEYKSKETTLTAVLPEYSSNDHIEIEFQDRPMYIGESARVHVSWWIADQTQGLNFEPSVFPDSILVTPVSPTNSSGQEHTLSLFGQRFSSYVEQGVYQGRTMTRLRFDLVLTPTRAGNFEFGPLRVVFTRQDEFSRTSRMYAESATETLRVIEVPTIDRPSGYKGLIGVFNAQTDASNTQVNVGDPIELRLLVAGPDPMIGLDKTLDAQSLESAGFRVSPDGWREVERRRSNERLFTTTVRATDDAIEAIPSIRLPAFNPETGEFEIFASDPIPLIVKAVRRVTLSDALLSVEDSGSDSDQETNRTELIQNPSLLWAHPSADGIRRSSRAFSLRQTLSEPEWAGALILIAGMPCMGLFVRRTRNRHDPRAAQIRQAWKHAQKLNHRGDETGAVRLYCGAILRISPESLTVADLGRLALSDTIAQRSSAMLSRSESSQYGTPSETRPDAALLKAMRQDLKSHHSSRQKSHRLPRAFAILITLLIACDSPGAQPESAVTLEQAILQLNAAIDRSTSIGSGDEVLQATAVLGFVLNQDGIRSANSHLTLGNAYFIGNDLGRSVLHYRKGLAVEPTNKTLQQNLAHARSFVEPVLPPDGSRFADIPAMLWWHRTIDGWTLWYGVVGLLGVASILWTMKFSGKGNRLPTLLPVAITAVGVLGLGLLGYDQWVTDNSRGVVVVAPGTSLYSGPGTGVYQEVYDGPLGVGTEAVMLETKGHWMRIHLGNDQSGWVTSDSIMPI